MRRRSGLLIVGLLASVVLGTRVEAQSVGVGSSPGRAAYRPDAQWNNGPFYTVPHVSPYAPRPAQDTGLIYNDAWMPPYTNGPHIPYPAYQTTRGALAPYAEGFSPYSGYANWYKRTYDFDPTDRQILNARKQFFRSGAPYVPPAASGYRGTETTNAAPTRPSRSVPVRPRVVTPREKSGRSWSGTVPVYRSSVAGNP